MKYSTKVLKNGLRIVTVPMKSNQTVTVMVLVEAGSNYETKEQNGLSHFLEHMCFKGTKKRTLHDITYELDSLGAHSNAFTGEEYTGYYAKAHYKRFSQLLSVVSDVYLNSTLPSEEINKERGVVIEELNMYEDVPQRKVWDVLSELMYKGQSAGRPIIGSKKNIQSFTQKDFLSYRKKHYVAKGTVVVVAGNIHEKEVEKEVEEAFASISVGKKDTKKKTIEIQKKPQLRIKNKKTDQTHFTFGFRAFDLYDTRNWEVDLIATVLGKGMSSRLFKRMRDELGMCYYVGAANDTSSDHGVFNVYAGVSIKRLPEAVAVILEELFKLKDELISPKELTKAKQYAIGNIALNLESSSDFTNWYGFQNLYREDIRTPEEVIAKIKKVTAEDIQKSAQTIFTPQNLNLAVIGNVSDKTKLEKLLTL